ncbi:uncharacterized protein LOC111470024 isoform X2 [Cucurbita maxima]|uniref:Uncharacterized protein LOC111470024 isoform X2 n=1 Tax=Cucurbita maxima TaxID=3661 RepID=A0A6J1I6A1_CUCMA|nr:uncharacterized protein LOC111470024 isoform X2 [Cucurbita maxima]
MITRLAQRERRIIIYVMQLFGCNYMFKVLPSIDCILGTARFFKSSIFALDNSDSFGRLPDWSMILANRSNEKLNYKNEWRGLKVKVKVEVYSYLDASSIKGVHWRAVQTAIFINELRLASASSSFLDIQERLGCLCAPQLFSGTNSLPYYIWLSSCDESMIKLTQNTNIDAAA